jgi:hypothetical protein
MANAKDAERHGVKTRQTHPTLTIVAEVALRDLPRYNFLPLLLCRVLLDEADGLSKFESIDQSRERVGFPKIETGI